MLHVSYDAEFVMVMHSRRTSAAKAAESAPASVLELRSLRRWRIDGRQSRDANAFTSTTSSAAPERDAHALRSTEKTRFAFVWRIAEHKCDTVLELTIPAQIRFARPRPPRSSARSRQEATSSPRASSSRARWRTRAYSACSPECAKGSRTSRWRRARARAVGASKRSRRGRRLRTPRLCARRDVTRGAESGGDSPSGTVGVRVRVQ